MELYNTNLQAIDLNQSCSGQTHSNWPGIGNRYESTKPECIYTVLCVPSTICRLSDTRVTRGIQLSSRPEIGKLYKMFWPGITSPQVTLAA